MHPLNLTAMRESGYEIQMDTNNEVSVCYFKTLTRTDGLWQAENPMKYTLYLLVMQLILIMFFNRIVVFILRPLCQPRIVADILAGVLLGPSAIGYYPFMRRNVLPFNSMLTLETVANLGLVYYMFLVGLELDFKPIIGAGKKAFSIAIVGIIVALPVGFTLHFYVLRKDSTKLRTEEDLHRFWFHGPMFWGVALATTNFAEVAQILANLKLLYSEIGRVALSAAAISDLCSGFLLILGIAVASDRKAYTIGTTLTFILVFVFLVRPALSWLSVHCTTKEDSYNEVYICFILSGIVLCGFVTDVCGLHSIVGPFVLGAIMPKGLEFKNILVERVGNFVSSIMMPFFYLVVGLKFNFERILVNHGPQQNGTSILDVVLVVALAFTTKIVSTSITALINKMTLRESLVLGFLMNTKGLMALIILVSGRDLKALNQQTYAIMLVVIWVMTVPVGPFLALTYKSTRRSPQYKLRNIQSVGADTDLRILACTHTSSNTSSIIDLIEASNPSKQSPIYVFAVQLVKLTDHKSAMLIVHDACKTNIDRNNGESESNFTSNVFENYALQRENVFVQALTVVSAYTTMHEDICTLAEDKRCNLIIIPFHEKSTMDEDMLEDSDNSFMGINKNVIKNSPCSVGVFVDRGLSASKILGNCNTDCNIMGRHKFALLFLGGTDDREALAYAWRMASHPRVDLTVIRLTLPKMAVEQLRLDDNNESLEKMAVETVKQKQLDDLYMDEFRLKSMNNPTIKLLEEQVNSWEETHSLIKTMEGEYALCIVGRGQGNMLSFKETSMDCSDDSDELGPLGEALVSSRFMTTTSILIIKQGAPLADINMENKMGHVEEQFGHTTWQPHTKNSTDNVIRTANF